MPSAIGPDATVTEEWADGESFEVRFRPPAELWEEHGPLICYLSQHFVNRLCGESGIAKELIEEIERVIFEQTDKTKRFETNSFKDLSEHLRDPIVRMRQTHVNDIHCRIHLGEFRIIPLLVAHYLYSKKEIVSCD